MNLPTPILRTRLPLLGFADWNDTVNLPTGAESMMAANMYGKALLDMLDLCELVRAKCKIPDG
ncbi:hypothetical protein O9992_22190 [Vibrio lentus]|nr:hypothetical protein [Vibrio lentus]